MGHVYIFIYIYICGQICLQHRRRLSSFFFHFLFKSVNGERKRVIFCTVHRKSQKNERKKQKQKNKSTLSPTVEHRATQRLQKKQEQI